MVGSELYWRRNDRSVRLLGRNRQEALAKMHWVFAGCGGVGGRAAEIAARAGVGQVTLIDPDVFEESNLNRQAAATQKTLGTNKAVATSNFIYDIVGNDVQINVYPEPFGFNNGERILRGADVVFCEIEINETDPRIAVDEISRQLGILVFDCNVVAFGARLTMFNKESMSMQEYFGIGKGAPRDEETRRRLSRYLVPRMPAEVTPGALEDFHKTGVAPICAFQPPASASLVTTRAALKLLGMERPGRETPLAPGYILMDNAGIEAEIVSVEQALREREE